MNPLSPVFARSMPKQLLKCQNKLTISKESSKSWKEKSEMKMETDDLVANVEALTKSKQVYEKQCRNLEESAADAKAKHDDHEKNLNEANAKKARMASEINELKR